MFTGIIDHQGIINHIDQTGFSILSQFENIQIGESIAVDGVCLTVTKFEGRKLFFDVSKETISKTTIMNYHLETPVNLERALRLGDSMGGHWVTGHIDTQLKVKEINIQGEFTYFRFTYVPSEYMPVFNQRKYIISKGSVCLNGISLTVNNCFEDGFDVMLIPQTLKITTMSKLQVNDLVNVEYDNMTKIIAHQFEIYKREIL